MTPAQLLAWRQRLAITQAAAAAALGMSLRAYHGMEHGARISRAVELACRAIEAELKA